MLGRALAIAALLLTAGCAVGERPVLLDEATNAGVAPGAEGSVLASATTVAGEPAPSTTPIDGADSSSGSADPADAGGDELPVGALGDAPPVVITATGVVVPVVQPAPGGLVVRTPCGNDAEIVWAQAASPVDVVLDPGHGGDEPGARGPNGETEAEVNLDIARRTARELEVAGFTVALTRTADYRITIPVRAALADRLEARALVSIHHNSPHPDISPDRTDPGTEVYTQADSIESARLGRLIYDRVMPALRVFDAEWASRTDAGVLTVIDDTGVDAYGIIRRPVAPTALVELAYLSNPTEALVLSTTEYREAMAAAIGGSIVEFLTTTDAGSDLVDGSRLFNPSTETGGSDGCIDPPLQ